MRYLLLVSHGTMAPGVHSVIRMLLGDRDNVLSYSMEDGVSADDFVAALGDVVAPVTPDDSVVVLGDIMGGSPLTNTLNLLTQRGLLANTIAFGGLSLPMAIAALMGIEDGLEGDAYVENVLAEARAGATKVELVLDDDDGGARFHQLVKHFEQYLYVERVQADGRLVEDEDRVLLRFSHLGGQL